MRSPFIVALVLAYSLPALSQTAPAPSPATPKDPAAILAAAAPFYDFTSPDLKPWHLKAGYQLYDDAGNPTEKGTFEYWWTSPQVYRTTWMRPGATHSDWHTADNKHAYQATGESLSLFEYKIRSTLLSPLPDAADTDPAKFRLDGQTLSAGGVKLPCIQVIPIMPQHDRLQIVPLGWFPSYCFDPRMPILRLSFSLGRLTMEFDKVVKVQNRFLPREFVMAEGKKKILSAQVDEINGIPPSDPALIPGPDVPEIKHPNASIDAKVMTGMLIKKDVPVYPQDAKDARVSGTVVLQATIGRDGGVYDLRVLSAPWPSLAASALWAVSHWRYKPYLLNGEPVEVETTVTVIYSLGG